MTRDWELSWLTIVGVPALAVGLGALVASIRLIAVLGLAVGSVALSLAICSQLFRSNERVSFPVAILAVALPAPTTTALVYGFSLENLLGSGGVAVFVFTFGAGLAFPLGVARTPRQQWIVVTALCLLGELFVALAVLDQNTQLEMEGVLTMLGLALVPVFALFAAPLYSMGATLRRTLHDDDDREHRPMLAAVALPWVAGTLALVVPPVLDAGLRGLPTPVGSTGLLVFLAIGAAFVYGVHRRTSPETT